MKFTLSHNDRILTLVESEKVERGQLSKSLTKKLEYYNFLPMQVKKRWNGVISYFHQDKYVPSGLWMELRDIAKKYNFPIEIEGLRNLFFDIDGQEFKDYVDKKFEGSKMPPRGYQIDAAYKILKHNLCISELATSAGKSLIVFIVFSYLLDNKINKRCLMIVPTINLVIQAFEDFHEYNNGLKEENKTVLNIKQIHGGESKDFTMDQNIFVGTFQSLILFPDTFLHAFDVVCVDETHKAKAKTIQDIIGKCTNAVRKFGLTGTVPKKGTLDWLTLQAYLGPLVTEIKAKELQDAGFISKLFINVIEIHHEDKIKEGFDVVSSTIEDKARLLKMEQDTVIQSTKRKEIIKRVVNKCDGNQLVLFHRTSYGKELHKYLKENTDKDVYYIDGGVNKDVRNEIKHLMENGTDKVLVASYGTLSTGVSIKNIHYIHLTESFKSDVIIRQSLGRGLRLHKDKALLYVFDYTDVLRTTKKNLLYFHSKARQKIYDEQQFPYKIKEVRL